MRLLDFVHNAKKQLNTLETPELDIVLLVEYVTGRNRVNQYLSMGEMLSDDDLLLLNVLLKRRSSGEPMAYILGKWGFREIELKVTPDTLIPRPETELLVELAMQKLKPDQSFLDLGTGSGAIALSVATEMKNVHVTATDMSQAALTVAQENGKLLNCLHVSWACGSWFEPLNGRTFDVIASNPPYIAEGDAHLVDLSYEPVTALSSGNDGLCDIRKIICEAREYLSAGGWLLLEHGYDQGKAVRDILQQENWLGIQTHQDLGGKDRVTMGQIPC